MSGEAASRVSGGASARGEDTAWLGMVLFLGSGAMLFASLFFAYGVLRLRHPVWPPAGLPAFPKLLPLVNTAVLGLNAVALRRALRAEKRGVRTEVLVRLGEGLFWGSLFLGLQAVLWTSLLHRGLSLDDGALAAVLYGLTGVHALHLVIGLGALAALLPAMAGRNWDPRSSRLRLLVMYFHFTFLAWLAMYLLLFVA